jgi:anaerobic ribonucleoside-triphosphate reductase activating protein
VRVLISRVHFPVTTLGWGRRVGIWTQGCSIGCARCIARDTWPADPGTDIPVAELLRVVAECGPVDGVTVSGGEPLDQPEALRELIIGLREVLGAGERDVLCYTGRSRSAVEAHHRNVLESVDAMVVGPFVWHKACDDPLRGSSNQEVLCTTALGEARYGAGRVGRSYHLRVTVTPDRINTVGVPAPGDLAALDAAAGAAGLRIAEASWHTKGVER